MSYAFDNSPFSVLFRNYYPARFPSLWKKFDTLVAAGGIISTKEVLHEIEDSSIDNLRLWVEDNNSVFPAPTAEEAKFVADIFSVPHFQHNIERQKLLKGGRLADPFVIARAAVAKCPVVTVEKLKPNGAKIPNICQHFGVKCLSLEEFMEAEGWTF